MKKTIKVKRWIVKNVLGQKITSGRPKKQQLLPVVTQPEPQVIYQQQYEQSHRMKGTFDMKALALTVTVSLFGVGLLVWWLQTYVSDTAALVALSMIGFFVFHMLKDLMDTAKLRAHNESQRITAEMLTDFNRQDAMTDNYRQKTTIENLRLSRQQLSHEQQQLRNERQQLLLEQRHQNTMSIEEEDDEFEVAFKVHK